MFLCHHNKIIQDFFSKYALLKSSHHNINNFDCFSNCRKMYAWQKLWINYYTTSGGFNIITKTAVLIQSVFVLEKIQKYLWIVVDKIDCRVGSKQLFWALCCTEMYFTYLEMPANFPKSDKPYGLFGIPIPPPLHCLDWLSNKL